MFSIAKLKRKQIITKHFVTFFTKKLTFCHLIDLNQENMVCLFGFVVLDNMKRWVSMCPITPQCCMSRKKKMSLTQWRTTILLFPVPYLYVWCFLVSGLR